MRDAAWASLSGGLYGGVILVGFALQLGAGPLAIGLLAAIPFLAQLAQLPAVSLIERWRRRRELTVLASIGSRLLVAALALVPFVDPGAQLALLLAAQLAIALLGSVAGCSFNSWLHQLLAGRELGALFARRLVWSTLLASGGALLSGTLVEHGPLAGMLQAYSLAFAAAALAGLASSWYLAQVPEPPMARTGPPQPLRAMLGAALRDPRFRPVVIFMGAWNFAANLAAPFLTVYLLEQMDLRLATVTTLWAASQVANALTLYLWGRLSDRLSNKAILAIALPAYFGCLVALPFTALPEIHALTLPLLALIHLVLGAASGGIGLATGNLGLKLAPQGRGTAYLATVSVAGALAGGIAAILGGALAEWFASRQLELLLHWSSPSAHNALTVVNFQHWEFLFALAFALGGYVLHALSRIDEGPEISERAAMQQLVFEARSAVLVPFGRLFERRLRPRRATPAAATPMPGAASQGGGRGPPGPAA